MATNTSSDIDVVESFLAALEALDIDRALALLADDVVYQNVPFPPDRGKRAVARTLGAFGKVATRFEVHMHHIAEREGTVLTERTDVIVGPLLYLDIWVCGTFEVRDGKITLWRDYFDLGQLGARLLTSPLRWLVKR
ncbi:MAG: nuclear transport factor 2 family protein [Polyangiaceae bacterium]|nr:nuclear transport factor 2 family protein [Polyangiaceae bacterium]